MGREIVWLISYCSFGGTQKQYTSRPKTIDDVSAQEHTIAVLRKTLTSTNVCSDPCLKRPVSYIFL
jgi:hypothetical protein